MMAVIKMAMKTHYTYMVSAANSEKYYYGKSHVKKENASHQDCKNHNYWGSGGLEFSNWLNKHHDTKIKTIISLHEFAEDAYKAEKILIGNAWRDDELCLNNRPGGLDQALFLNDYSLKSITVKECVIDVEHGITKHMGDSCYKCARNSSKEIRFCEIHGRVNFRVNLKKNEAICETCLNNSTVEIKECNTHDKSNHIGDNCYSCNREITAIKFACKIHGTASLFGSKCRACGDDNINKKYCSKCKEKTTHNGTACYVCKTNEAIKVKECEKIKEHGFVKHRGDSCYKCRAEKRFINAGLKFLNCNKHGRSRFDDNECLKCQKEKINKSSNSILFKECLTHGIVKHIGNSCYSCRNQKTALSILTEEKFCEVCEKQTNHRSNKCMKCKNNKSIKILNCPNHGEVKHKGNYCFKCGVAKRKISRGQNGK